MSPRMIRNPTYGGEFSKEEILSIGEKARSKKKANTKPVKEILKKIFQDLKILKESKESALQRIQRYLDQREVEKRGIQEY